MSLRKDTEATGRIPPGDSCGSLSAMSWCPAKPAVLSCTTSFRACPVDSILNRALYLSPGRAYFKNGSAKLYMEKWKDMLSWGVCGDGGFRVGEFEGFRVGGLEGWRVGELKSWRVVEVGKIT